MKSHLTSQHLCCKSHTINLKDYNITNLQYRVAILSIKSRSIAVDGRIGDKSIIGSLDNSTVRVWEMGSGLLVNLFASPDNKTVRTLCFNDTLLVTHAKKSALALWEIISPKLINFRQCIAPETAMLREKS